MQNELKIRVYYEDTDAGGVVYHANYIKFCERARSETLRAAGFDNHSLIKDPGILFVVRQLEADYLAPARLDDALVVRSSLLEYKNASFRMLQEIYREESLVFAMKIWLVCINLEGRPTRVPDNLREALNVKKE